MRGAASSARADESPFEKGKEKGNLFSSRSEPDLGPIQPHQRVVYWRKGGNTANRLRYGPAGGKWVGSILIDRENRLEWYLTRKVSGGDSELMIRYKVALTKF